MIALVLLLAADDPVTLARVQRSAAAHFPAIAAATRELAAAEAERLAADGGFDPRFVTRAQGDVSGYYRAFVFDTFIEQPTPLWGASVFTGYRVGLGTFPDYEGKQVTGSAGELRAGVNVPLLRNGPIDRARAGIERARYAVDRARAGVAATELDVVRAASLRYFAWVGAALKLRLAEQMLALALERQDGLVSRVKAGDVPEIERIDNDRAIAQRRAFVAASARALDQAALELSLYLRDDAGLPIVPSLAAAPEDLAEPAGAGADVDRLAEQARTSRPDLRRLRASVLEARVDARLQQNQLWPALDLRAGVAQDFGVVDPTRRQFEMQLGVVLDVPLAFRLQRGRVRAAEAMVARGELTLRLQEDRAVNEVRDALSAARRANERIRALTDEVALAEKLAGMERTRLSLGESTVLVVNLREQASVEARARRVDALVDAHRAEIDLLAAVGTRPGDGAAY